MKEVIKLTLAIIGAFTILALPILVWSDNAVAMVRLNGAYSAAIVFLCWVILYKENE